VDLIAEERGPRMGQHPLLFQLLNEMDGLGEDLDVTFLLTTNRPDLLEAALAARPGRVDHAAELPLPDAEARRRLLELYRGSLVLDLSDPDDVITRTEGVTAAFLKELLRRAALAGCRDRSGPRRQRRRRPDPGDRRAPDRGPGPAARRPGPADQDPARRARHRGPGRGHPPDGSGRGDPQERGVNPSAEEETEHPAAHLTGCRHARQVRRTPDHGQPRPRDRRRDHGAVPRRRGRILGPGDDQRRGGDRRQ